MTYIDEYKKSALNLEKQTVNIDKIFIEVDVGVFSPDPKRSYSTQSILDNFPDVRDKRVLDMGTGTGILAIKAAQKGAKHVLAVDSDIKAVNNATRNVEKVKLSNVILIKKSNLFEDVDGTFDVILANLPISEEISFGAKEIVKRFLNHIRTYLNPDGIVLFSFADFGNVKEIESLFAKNKLLVKLSSENKLGAEWFLYKVQLKNQWADLGHEYAQADMPSDEIGYVEVFNTLGNINGKHILDYGCGPGIISKRLVEKGAQVIGVDSIEKTIKLAKKNVDNAKFYTEEDYKQQTAYYDAALLLFVICTNQKDSIISEVLSNIYKELKPGGKLIILEPHPDAHNHGFLSVQRKIDNPQNGSPVKVKLGGMTTEFYDYWRSKEFYMESLKKAGFKKIEILEPLAQGKGWKDETIYPPAIILTATK